MPAGALLRPLDAGARAQEGPRASPSRPWLVIEAPPALEPVADRVAATTRRGSAGDAPDRPHKPATHPGGPWPRREAARRAAPPTGRRATRTARKAPSSDPRARRDYPYGSLRGAPHHEVAHVLVGAPRPAAGSALVQRGARRWPPRANGVSADRSRLALELLPGSRVPASRLDELSSIAPAAAGADRAYAPPRPSGGT